MTAPAVPRSLWILTDGKAGDVGPLAGVAEALGIAPELRTVRPTGLCALLAPHGPIPARDRPDWPGSPLAPPFPDVCLATGRRAVPYARALKRAAPDCLVVVFKDPRTRRHGADLLVVQAHDAPRGPDVVVTVTAPHRFSAARIAALRADPPADLAGLPRPRVAVLVGGDSRHHRFDAAATAALVGGLAALADGGAGLMITTSRRTPPALVAALTELSARPGVRLWTGGPDNPLPAYLALADSVVVTADSTNMVGEAAATGAPLHVFRPPGGHPRIDRFLAALGRVATLRPFPGPLGGASYPPVDATPAMAEAIRARFAALRMGLTGSAPPARS
ncbi:mitochondrial fission ELM1 family protein [Oharaeibacter diazotrophicus]|uniref:Mitochondrial fission protein ELM1 n=3 Tax=Oharaeibacter diazotrophicus TaxID=1920512 RepID=A0A4R6R9C3_9HYPH|nr:mitochondrial fission ELM1 family protein [Oharaeibacter diazotrophicus]TDP82653.1 hypothetical protein EDD54_3922 [Oharaeibacter diazotrophicus]BBE72584.1 hypothetical protein OHA_1_02182 [Pleomorphomonas sp. SM30]GLS76616.1 hypothetical protein GCM10007904_19530 [Oharaeibacter diazotrophicus]